MPSLSEPSERSRNVVPGWGHLKTCLLSRDDRPPTHPTKTATEERALVQEMMRTGC